MPYQIPGGFGPFFCSFSKTVESWDVRSASLFELSGYLRRTMKIARLILAWEWL